MAKTIFKKIQQHYINTLSTKSKIKKDPEYILVDKRFLHLNDHINFNLFTPESLTHMTLFLQSDSIIDNQQQQEIRKIEQLYVSDTEKDAYDNFLEENLQSIFKDDSISLDEKTDLIYLSTKELTQSLYSNPDALENVQRSESIVTPILESVLYNDDTISSYIKIIEYDYYTHTHSLNVSIYSICLGLELGLEKNRLKLLGQAALLHDLGKSKIDSNIVNKDGKLTSVEFETMKMHPAFGHKTAKSIGIQNEDILDGIRHHHEKLDGRGYPDSLKEEEIGLLPRIIGICDVFDALTTRRSYKQAMHSFDALRLMKTEMSTHLDMKIFNIFIKMLHK